MLYSDSFVIEFALVSSLLMWAFIVRICYGLIAIGKHSMKACNLFIIIIIIIIILQ
jgi:hypothetical protein